MHAKKNFDRARGHRSKFFFQNCVEKKNQIFQKHYFIFLTISVGLIKKKTI